MTRQNMNLYLWIAQIVLALTFLGSGLAKITMSKEKMAATGRVGVVVTPKGPRQRDLVFWWVSGLSQRAVSGSLFDGPFQT